jgi:hypothetical protein
MPKSPVRTERAFVADDRSLSTRQALAAHAEPIETDDIRRSDPTLKGGLARLAGELTLFFPKSYSDVLLIRRYDDRCVYRKSGRRGH